MTIGEHLDELRGCVLRSLVAVVLACLLCIWPARYLFEFMARPLMLVLRHFEQSESFLATHPVEVLLIYIKVVLISGLVISSPYVIKQIWSFVAAGLYGNEQKWVQKLVPVSVGLFLAGVAFMYTFALPLCLKFLVGFSAWLPMPNSEPNWLDRQLIGRSANTTTQPTTTPADVTREPAAVPSLEEDPLTPAGGMVWFNTRQRRLKFFDGSDIYSTTLRHDNRRSMVSTHLKLGEYFSFVLILMLAFGLAFQIPLVVVFLVRTGIMSVQTLRQYRKMVILVIVIIAGILAPPDIMSHLLLSGPMLLLFELGLLIASRTPAGKRAARERN